MDPVGTGWLAVTEPQTAVGSLSAISWLRGASDTRCNRYGDENEWALHSSQDALDPSAPWAISVRPGLSKPVANKFPSGGMPRWCCHGR
jgi:hypothetical protein